MELAATLKTPNTKPFDFRDISTIGPNATPGMLTTEHARSSYGQPVLIVNGKAHGPADLPKGYRIEIQGSGDERFVPIDYATGAGLGAPVSHEHKQAVLNAPYRHEDRVVDWRTTYLTDEEIAFIEAGRAIGLNIEERLAR